MIIWHIAKKIKVYIYNATTRQTRELITGNDNFVIKSYENNTLKYDDKSIECNI